MTVSFHFDNCLIETPQRCQTAFPFSAHSILDDFCARAYFEKQHVAKYEFHAQLPLDFSCAFMKKTARLVPETARAASNSMHA
jgi:hypothetical protein